MVGGGGVDGWGVELMVGGVELMVGGGGVDGWGVELMVGGVWS